MTHEFPILFAVRAGGDRVAILESHAMLPQDAGEQHHYWNHYDPHPSRVIGLRPVTTPGERGFWLSEHPPERRREPLTIVEWVFRLPHVRPPHHRRYEVRDWTLTGDYLYTARYPMSIPILDLQVPLEIIQGAWMRAWEGTPADQRAWWRHHHGRRRRPAPSDDETSTDESDAEPRRRPPPRRAAAGGAAASAPAAQPPDPTAIPAFVAEALVTAAIAKGATCPISMEPLATATAVGVTSCFHLFDASSIAIWLTTTGAGCCPVCKQRCALTLPSDQKPSAATAAAV